MHDGVFENLSCAFNGLKNIQTSMDAQTRATLWSNKTIARWGNDTPYQLDRVWRTLMGRLYQSSGRYQIGDVQANS